MTILGSYHFKSKRSLSNPFAIFNIGEKRSTRVGLNPRLGMLPVLLLGGNIENQNSDFVMQESSFKLSCMTKS